MRKLKIIPLKRGGEKIKTQLKRFEYIRHHYLLVKNIKQITAPPKKGETIHIVTQSQFNALTFIPYFLEKEIVENIILTTFSISIKSIETIAEMIAQQLITGCFVLVSEFILNLKKKGIIQKLNIEEGKSSRFNWGYGANHSKIILIKTQSNWYVVEGSGNMTMNARIEQYVLTNSKELYNFHKEWILGVKKRNTERSCNE